ncbi:MAG TPA: hypothetical protein VM286_04825 [Candidatus Thermoplasmatota archaeon]|nr:hypothetical protein [Candidatus Thermoplasmatota archaeon]
MAALLVAGAFAHGVGAQSDPPINCQALVIGPIPDVGPIPLPLVPGGGIPKLGPCTAFQLFNTFVQKDQNRDGAGDDWQKSYDLDVLGGDTDHDGLTDLNEYKWLSNPIVADSDADGWQDGPEASYWSKMARSEANPPPVAGYAVAGPGSQLDTDGDHVPNIMDADSDNDGLLDGAESNIYHTDPAVADTDQDGILDGGVTPLGAPHINGEVHDYGTNPVQGDSDGDGLEDAQEIQYWQSRGNLTTGANRVDTDHDGLWNAVDLDSDNDGLSDGEEVTTYHSDPTLSDTDGDSMPDAWEAHHSLDPASAADANLDADGDELANVAEYQADTDPHDMDTDNDLLLDGEEVNTYHTNPLNGDSDSDGMPDRFEIQHGLLPLDATDAVADPDGDSFDQGADGSIEQAWPNLAEYQYGRPIGYSEAASGPWLAGTDPHKADTDGDGAPDGYEAYYGTNPVLPADGSTDEDKDGLNFTQEVRHGTDPGDPDTDGDGLCDGGRAANCFFPGLGTTGFQPGESDYGSVPWMTDSDGDGIPDGQEAQKWDPSATGRAQDLDHDSLGGIIDSDSDGDGLADGSEIVYHADMAVSDSDQDGLNDGPEVNTWATSPTSTDSDQDGLLDGAEAMAHHTDPAVADSDGDGVGDGQEVNRLGTDPLSADTDQDHLPDGWEAAEGTQPRVSDAGQDIDIDGLSNAYEFIIGTHPNSKDSDGDGMPDTYEDTYLLDPAHDTAAGDADGDGLANLDEYAQGTNPLVVDSDGDGIDDGPEIHLHQTNPLMNDTDNDGLGDGVELAAWNMLGSSAWNTNYDGDTFANNLLDSDSDGDQLSDGYEFVTSHTDPKDTDSDGDGLTDYQEVFVYQGQYDPNKADTDGDGQSDGVEVALADTNGDADKDGIKNGDEGSVYGTDPTVADTDCDGINDGPELAYWGATWSMGGNRLRQGDVDGDTLKDGLEIASMDAPGGTFTRTLPDKADSDNDLLGDAVEAQNNARVTCGTSSQRLGPVNPLGGLNVVEVANNAAALATLGPGVYYRGPDGNVYAKDLNGLFVQGGYGIHLYLNLPGKSANPLSQLSVKPSSATYASMSPGTNGKRTDPLKPDTDGDGLLDGVEITASLNPFSGPPLDPTLCDTDHDGLGDGLELGLTLGVPVQNGADPSCNQRDMDPATKTDPNNPDTDGDGATDGRPAQARGQAFEDGNGNGRLDGATSGYCGIPGAESDPQDADTDDDGISDGAEILGSLGGIQTSPYCFDLDGDGLSDGLEQGLGPGQFVPATTSGGVLVQGTNPAHTVSMGSFAWPTWQAWSGTTDSASRKITTLVDDGDSDNDGVIDGLEDLNHNGKFGTTDSAELDAKSPDTDGDGLADGLELMIWGSTSNPNFTPYTFPDAVAQWHAVSLLDVKQKLQWNPANKLQTDPRNANTDGTDLIPDGLDVNPLGDAKMTLTFGFFQMLEKPDADCPWCEDGWAPDVKISLLATLPSNVGFTANTIELDLPRAKEGFDLGGWLNAHANFVTDTGSPSGVMGLVWTGGRVLMDLYDSVDQFPTTSACKDAVCLSLHFREIDDAPFEPDSNDNDVDFEPCRRPNILWAKQHPRRAHWLCREPLCQRLAKNRDAWCRRSE